MRERLEFLKNAPNVNAAVVLVVDGRGRVALLKRRDDDRSFSDWCLPGGKIEPEEGSYSAAIRELYEELPGLTAACHSELEYRCATKSWSERAGKWYGISAYSCRFSGDIGQLRHGPEHEGLVFVYPAEALQHLALGGATRAILGWISSGYSYAAPSPRLWPIAGRAPLFPDEPGRFGAVRRHDVHTGVDLYCEEGDPIVSATFGEVIAVEAFTGPDAEDPSPHWNNTQAVLVLSGDKVLVYGEIESAVSVGDVVHPGDLLGVAVPVLKNDKGRPMVMLHFEIMVAGALKTLWWRLAAGLGGLGSPVPEPMPRQLLDPTSFLYGVAGSYGVKTFSMSTYDGLQFKAKKRGP